MTSGLYLTESNSFFFSDFGLPRSARIGNIASSCALVSGLASGSAFAAFKIFSLSSFEGISIKRLAEILDIVFDLFPFGSTQADWPSDFVSVDKSNIVKPASFRCERNHPNFVVFETLVHPDHCFIPDKPLRHCQGKSVTGYILFVLLRIKLEMHALM